MNREKINDIILPGIFNLCSNDSCFIMTGGATMSSKTKNTNVGKKKKF